MRSFDQIRHFAKHINLALLTVMTAFALSSCGMISFGDDEEKAVEEEAPRLKGDELKTDVTVSNAENLAKPPFDDAPLPEELLAAETKKVEPVVDATPEPASQMMGLKTNRLFDEKIRDDDDRMARLESAVQLMRDDFDAVKPTIDRLSTVEADLQGLVSQLNTLVAGAPPPDDIQYNQLNNDPVAIESAMGVSQIQAAPTAPVQTAPIPAQDPAPVANDVPLQLAPPPPAPNAPAQAAKAVPPAPQPAPVAAPTPPPAPAIVSGAQLVNIRMADSAGKTRVVMETTGPMNFSSDLDNNEHILTLIFPAGSAKDMGNLQLKSTLVKSVSETPQPNGGFILAFTLNKNSSILDQGAIPPGATSPHHRLWIDLSR